MVEKCQIKDEDIYIVILDESYSISKSQRNKIEEIDSDDISESKIPFTDIDRTSYFSADQERCETFIKELDSEIQKLFKIEKFYKNNFKYTAFLDILGFSSHIKKDITNDYEAEEFHSKLSEIKEYIEWLSKETLKNDTSLLDNIEIKYSWISDTFVMIIENTEDIEPSVDKKYLMLFILSSAITTIHHFIAKEFGLLLRGGISSKYACITNNLILGEAISETGKLEKDIAIYPRVIFEKNIIDDEIYEIISRKYSDNDLNFISKDCDGYYFVNYIAMLQDHVPMIGAMNVSDSQNLLEIALKYNIDIIETYQQIVDKNLKEFEKKEEIRQKYQWLNEYLGKVILNEIFQKNMQEAIQGIK